MSMVGGLAILLALLLFLPGSEAALLNEGSSPLVLAFYYNWFDENTWKPEKVSDFPVSLYNSRDRETVVRHIAQAQEIGIDAFVVAWYGPQDEGNQTEPNLALMLEVADGTDFQVSVEFGPDSPFIHSQQEVVDALRHVLQVHAQHPSFLRVEGKPVIFFWRLDSIPLAPEQTPLQAWQAVRDQVDPDHESLWIAEGVEVDYQQVFDGHHLYSIAWSQDVHSTLSDWGYRIRRYNAQHGTDKLWVATVMPGYNDLKTGRADAFVREREDGQFYRDTWQAAMDSGADWVVITSWNEWVEGSYIEPSVSYGNLYLDLTAELVAQFKARADASALTTPAPTPSPSLTVATAITPTATLTPTLTATSTPTHTPSPTATATLKPMPTATSTSTPTLTATPTASPTATPTINPTPNPTATPTPAPLITPLVVAAYISRCLSLVFLGGAIVVGALLLRDWRKGRG
ncbi:MAG: endo-1,3-alpha-glucanase family glycosylhydrolase [Anaerolineae bacterium]